ncbi:hypothetical protein [Mycobacteroides chelonae]|uniref:hypothetical protein n=1 Tax=Mycobacteroides chelonae TaxID=1774 RepID=UPI001041DCD6|nr:hypothetical protein [Mycobacteroides chelonae]
MWRVHIGYQQWTRKSVVMSSDWRAELADLVTLLPVGDWSDVLGMAVTAMVRAETTVRVLDLPGG